MQAMTTNTGWKKKLGIILYVVGFLILEIVFGYFIVESRNIFMKNSIQYGSYLAQTQVKQIETRMGDYAFSVELAGKYLDEMMDTDMSETEIQQWMKSYCNKITERFGDNVLDLYAVLDGRIVAANPWEGEDYYDFSSKSWYSEAIEAEPGTIVFSSLYKDVVTKQNVFTMSLELSETGNVVAMDVYLTSENWMGFSELAEGYGLLVYDPNQMLAYSVGYTDLSTFQGDILDSASNEVSQYIGSVKEKHNLYACTMSSGWSVVVAVPSENLISSKHILLMDLGLGLNVLNMVITTMFLIQHLCNSRYLRQDALTGLLNKSYLVKQIRKRLKRSNGTLLIADLDNFKKLNDTYGHDHGDLVIIKVAEVLQSCFRKTDCIGRFGGDEFIIYMDSSLPDDILNCKAQEIMRQVDMLARQYPLSDLSISIGGCRCQKGDQYMQVFKGADEELYKVKKSGKCGFSINSHL